MSITVKNVLIWINADLMAFWWGMTGHDSAVSCSCASRRSDWPGLMRAGSSVSIRLVAMMTLTSPRESKPSSWLSSSNMVLWISRSPPELESYLEIAETFTWRCYRTVWWLDSHVMSDPIRRRVDSLHWTPIHYYTSQHATKVLCKTVHQKTFASLMKILLKIGLFQE